MFVLIWALQSGKDRHLIKGNGMVIIIESFDVVNVKHAKKTEGGEKSQQWELKSIL